MLSSHMDMLLFPMEPAFSIVADTARQSRASFERRGGATGAGGRGGHGTGRTGGAVRHAGEGAEREQAGSSGSTRCGVERLAEAFEAGESGASGWDHRRGVRQGWPRACRLARVLGQSSSRGAAGSRGPGAGGLAPSTYRSAARESRAGHGGLCVGGLDFRYHSHHEAHRPGNGSTKACVSHLCQALGRSSPLSFMR